MMLIDCPFCGPRDETEFSCGGEAHIARPLAENKISDAEFADYLFMRDNPKGLFLERWRHSAGCRRWFNMARDTVSHEIVEIYPMGALPKTAVAKSAYNASWRRNTAAEHAAIQAHITGKNARKTRGAK
jgi:sarcosine oxidase subunit delta